MDFLTAPPAALLLLLSLEHQSKVDFSERSLQSPRGSGREGGGGEEQIEGRIKSRVGEPEQVIFDREILLSVSCCCLHSNNALVSPLNHD